MIEMNVDPLGPALDELCNAMSAEPDEQTSRWSESVYASLGEVVAAIHEELEIPLHTVTVVGEVNSDLQNVPGTERHAETARAHLIGLAEEIHLMRARILQALGMGVQEVSQWRRQVREIIVAVEGVRREEDRFVLDSINSDLGSGE